MEEACLGRPSRPTFTGARALPQTGAAACKETYLTFVAASTVRGTARQRNLLNICDRRQLEEKDRNAGADGKLPEVAPALDQRQPQSAARSLISGFEEERFVGGDSGIQN